MKHDAIRDMIYAEDLMDLFDISSKVSKREHILSLGLDEADVNSNHNEHHTSFDLPLLWEERY